MSELDDVDSPEGPCAASAVDSDPGSAATSAERSDRRTVILPESLWHSLDQRIAALRPKRSVSGYVEAALREFLALPDVRIRELLDRHDIRGRRSISRKR